MDVNFWNTMRIPAYSMAFELHIHNHVLSYEYLYFLSIYVCIGCRIIEYFNVFVIMIFIFELARQGSEGMCRLLSDAM